MSVIRREKKKLSDEEIKKVENFIGGSESKFEQSEPVLNKSVSETNEEKKEVAAVKQESNEIRMYSLRIPADIYEKIELYVFQNRRKGANIRKFIMEAILDKIDKENL